ncbi:hypothetical protein DVDV_3774 [Desulfovibrio sp. DV]|nr:hypothetical protein DVDV_3774 [Desulfovibrio sp. DV]
MAAMGYPDRTSRYSLEGYDKLVFLENVVANPAISVGRYTYFDATGRRASGLRTSSATTSCTTSILSATNWP